MKRSRPIAGLLIGTCLFAPAYAQTPSPLPEWTYSAGVLLGSNLSPQAQDWFALGGVSAAYGPRYDGARNYRIIGGPTVELRYRDLAFLSSGEGLGINLLRGTKYRAGTAMGYDLGHRADDSGATRGLGNVGPAPELKGFAECLFSVLTLRAVVRRGLGGHDGWIADLGAYMPVYGEQTFFVFLGPSATLADDRYMGRYFGVTAAQSAASGYAPYAAHAGFKSVGLGASATRLLTAHWLVNLLAGGQRLLGAAAESPLTLERSQYAVSLTIGYQF